MMDCLQAACDKYGATLEGGLTKAYSAYSYTEDDPFVQELSPLLSRTAAFLAVMRL